LMLASLRKSISALKNDRQHGAGFLTLQALEILRQTGADSTAETAEKFLTEINQVADALIESHPVMVSIANYALFVKEELAAVAVTAKSPQRLKKTAFSIAGRLLKSQEKSATAASRHAVKLVSKRSIVMTCSSSSAVCSALEMARRAGTDFKVLAVDSRHNKISYGGITAERLQAGGISCMVVPDDQVGWHVARADYIFCGADAISLHGWLINGAPSLELAEVAARKKKPFYIVCETSKFDVRGFLAGMQQAEPGFDMVPLELVTGIVTERGVLSTDKVLEFTFDSLFGGSHAGIG
jgi:translation initiation factor 2B subunit (eIF-2B alpha/beta/delta family)